MSVLCRTGVLEEKKVWLRPQLNPREAILVSHHCRIHQAAMRVQGDSTSLYVEVNEQ